MSERTRNIIDYANNKKNNNNNDNVINKKHQIQLCWCHQNTFICVRAHRNNNNNKNITGCSNLIGYK